MSLSTVAHRNVEQAVRRNADWLALVLQVQPFIEADVPDEMVGQFRALRRTNAIEIVGSEPSPDHTAHSRDRYALSADAQALVLATLDQRDPICPCGHAGFQNVGDGFVCQFELCDRQFARDELEVDR